MPQVQKKKKEKKSLQTVTAGEGVEKKEPSYVIGGDVYWYNHYRKLQKFLTKLNIGLPYDPAIPLLGIHLENTTIRKDTGTPVFIASLFTITKTWKKPRHPSTSNFIYASTLPALQKLLELYRNMNAKIPTRSY